MVRLSCGDMPKDAFTSLSQLTILCEWSLGPFLLMFALCMSGLLLSRNLADSCSLKTHA